MIRPPRPRSVSNTALVASLGLGAAMVGGEAFAQAAPAAAPAASPRAVAAPAPMAVPEVSVTGVQGPNQLRAPTGNPRLPNSIQDTPQTITVVPQEVLREQNVTTLEQALRNVPGVTSTIGEGGGGVNGDQFRIRGFQAQNDVLVDGLRDFGAYQRDAFTYEDVQVLKGASSFAFGTSAIGGGVNVNSRLPNLQNSYGATVTGGTGPYARATADINQRISETAAIRLNVMGQRSSLVDRDRQDTSRWGFAPSIAFGLGTPTTFSLEYLHYQDNRVPDAGVPVVFRGIGAIGRPATEYGVRRSIFYGAENDIDNVSVDRLTARLSHRFADWLTVNNDTRVMRTNRYFSYSLYSCATAETSLAAYNASCSGQFFRGLNPVVTQGGGNVSYVQETLGIQNLTTGLARFTTGPFRHELTAGVDISRETLGREGYALSARPTVRLGDTTAINDTILDTVGSPNNERKAGITNLGLFVNERLYVLPTLSVYGGFRWTNYELDYVSRTPGAGNALTTRVGSSYDFFDPRAGVIWEPTPDMTFYYSFSRSTTPPGTFFNTNFGTVASFDNNLRPEDNTNHEVGAKFSLLNQRLGLSAALFQAEKGNVVFADADTGIIASSGDSQRVRGVEVGITGRITPEWNINAAYTYMDSETTRSLTAANRGKRAQYVPEHAASLWTTYDIARDTPYNVTLGAGVVYRGQVYLNAANTAEVPENLSFDALVQHRINQNLTVRVNGYNLTDRRNYEGLWTNRAAVSAGRTVLFSLAAQF